MFQTFCPHLPPPPQDKNRNTRKTRCCIWAQFPWVNDCKPYKSYDFNLAVNMCIVKYTQTLALIFQQLVYAFFLSFLTHRHTHTHRMHQLTGIINALHKCINIVFHLRNQLDINNLLLKSCDWKENSSELGILMLLSAKEQIESHHQRQNLRFCHKLWYK